MEKGIYLSCLFDYEIAEEYKVTKNAVSKTLIEVEKKLEYYESKLHLYENKEKIIDILKSDVDKIIDYI